MKKGPNLLEEFRKKKCLEACLDGAFSSFEGKANVCNSKCEQVHRINLCSKTFTSCQSSSCWSVIAQFAVFLLPSTKGKHRRGKISPEIITARNTASSLDGEQLQNATFKQQPH